MKTKKDERRDFIKKLLGGSAMAITLPSTAFLQPYPPVPLSNVSEEESPNEDFWVMVKSQYQHDPALIMMNAANFCASPFPVSQTMAEHLQGLDTNPSSQDRKKYKQLYKATVVLLAEYLGAGAAEIAITRNTSESNNIINNGIDLQPGDEIIYWGQNHETLNIAWEVRAKRAGFKAI